MPRAVRVAHELCFSLHDECARVLVEYEGASAHIETIQFTNQEELSKFEELAKSTDAVGALRDLGYHQASKRVVLNTITMAMVSDCLHHLYEALRCFEKRKNIVGFNLLRKPLKESLLYLSWIYGQPDEFYDQFTRGDPNYLEPSRIGNDRKAIYTDAIAELSCGKLFDSRSIESIIYHRDNREGFELFFQHAVHLVTTKYSELKTASENFNFIFKNRLDDDVYDLIYANLPYLFLFMSHVVVSIFNRMKTMDETSRLLFFVRSTLAFGLVSNPDKSMGLHEFRKYVSETPKCSSCGTPCSFSPYNAVRILLASKFRCANCRKDNISLLFSFP